MKYKIKHGWRDDKDIWYILDYFQYNCTGWDQGRIDDCDKFSLKVTRYIIKLIKSKDNYSKGQWINFQIETFNKI